MTESSAAIDLPAKLWKTRVEIGWKNVFRWRVLRRGLCRHSWLECSFLYQNTFQIRSKIRNERVSLELSRSSIKSASSRNNYDREYQSVFDQRCADLSQKIARHLSVSITQLNHVCFFFFFLFESHYYVWNIFFSVFHFVATANIDTNRGIFVSGYGHTRVCVRWKFSELRDVFIMLHREKKECKTLYSIYGDRSFQYTAWLKF